MAVLSRFRCWKCLDGTHPTVPSGYICDCLTVDELRRRDEQRALDAAPLPVAKVVRR